MLTSIMDDGSHVLQRARGPDREVGASPVFSNATRHGRGMDWPSGSPQQYYTRSPRNRIERNPRRSPSWSPRHRRQSNETSSHRNATEKSKLFASPEDNYRGEYGKFAVH